MCSFPPSRPERILPILLIHTQVAGNAASLASRLYIYKIRAGEFQAAKKMIYIK